MINKELYLGYIPPIESLRFIIGDIDEIYNINNTFFYLNQDGYVIIDKGVQSKLLKKIYMLQNIRETNYIHNNQINTERCCRG